MRNKSEKGMKLMIKSAPFPTVDLVPVSSGSYLRPPGASLVHMSFTHYAPQAAEGNRR